MGDGYSRGVLPWMGTGAAPRAMTQEQKDLLRPFAEIIANMHIRLAEMDPSEQAELLEACNAANGGNCWCLTYDAAQLLRPELQRLLSGK